MIKKVLSKTSVKRINKVLSQTDLYHFTEYPWQASLQDVWGHSLHDTRSAFMVGKYGFFGSLVKYKSALGRSLEYSMFGDYPHSLRQKINIVNEMVECNFKSNLPVHISVTPTKQIGAFLLENIGDKNRELDLYKVDNHLNFQFVVHPGQTRCQASVFAKTPLRNVLLYIPKESNIVVKTKGTKITEIDQLLEVYQPDKEVTNKTLEYDFDMPGQSDGLKYHNKQPILKCNQIKDSEGNSYHFSNFYTERSFVSIRDFCKIFWNGTGYNIYTPEVTITQKLQEKNRKELLGGNDKLLDILQYFENKPPQPGSELPLSLSKPNNPILNLSDEESLILTQLSNFYKNVGTDVHNKLSEQEENYHNWQLFLKGPNFIHTPLIKQSSDFKELVIKNDYRGFCVYIDIKNMGAFTRDLAELLFFINKPVPIAHNKNKSLAIINCEHDYWKTGKNYNSWNIEETFYT